VFKNIKLREILKFEKTKISEDEENYAVRNLIFTIHQIVRLCSKQEDKMG
jgi:hypothetical protein